MHGLVEIAPLPPVPRHDLFTYRVPTALQDRIQVGMRVRVPLGRQTRTGVVAGFAERAPATGDLRAILDIVDTAPFLPSDLLELCRWTARYYLTSLSDVIGTIVPARVPDAAEASAVRLARRLDDHEVASLERRARARAAAYRTLAAAPDGAMLLRDARAAGVGADAVRALVTAGIAERVRRPLERVPETPGPSVRPALTEPQREAAARLAEAVAAGVHASFLLHGITGSGKTEVFLVAAEATLAAGR